MSEMLERLARALCETNGNCSLRKFQDKPCIDEETGRNAPCRASRDHLLLVGMFDQVRAILNELKQVDEGMVEAAGLAAPIGWSDKPDVEDIFTAMIDHVLSEGEGK